MRVQVAAGTHVGLVRERNEDCLLLDGWVSQARDTVRGTLLTVDDPPRLVAVLDGMGGHAGGNVASLTAAAALADGLLPSRPDTATLAALVAGANAAVVELGGVTGPLADMGATLAGVLVGRERVDVFNVGDCRVHRVLGGYAGQVSVDDRASSGAVTQSLGRTVDRLFDVHHLVLDDLRGSTLLLSSDGLTDVVPTATVAEALADTESGPVEAQARALIALALQAGAPDNVSVALLRFAE